MNDARTFLTPSIISRTFYICKHELVHTTEYLFLDVLNNVMVSRLAIFVLYSSWQSYLRTYLLTYISSTIGSANFGPDWPLLFKEHEI